MYVCMPESRWSIPILLKTLSCVYKLTHAPMMGLKTSFCIFLGANVQISFSTAIYHATCTHKSATLSLCVFIIGECDNLYEAVSSVVRTNNTYTHAYKHIFAYSRKYTKEVNADLNSPLSCGRCKVKLKWAVDSKKI